MMKAHAGGAIPYPSMITMILQAWQIIVGAVCAATIRFAHDCDKVVLSPIWRDASAICNHKLRRGAGASRKRPPATLAAATPAPRPAAACAESPPTAPMLWARANQLPLATAGPCQDAATEPTATPAEVKPRACRPTGTATTAAPPAAAPSARSRATSRASGWLSNQDVIKASSSLSIADGELRRRECVWRTARALGAECRTQNAEKLGKSPKNW